MADADCSDPQALVEISFTRLAEQRGDVTADVIDRYYRHFPGVEESFAHHGMSDVAELEGRMVTATIFMLMQWVENPNATKIEQGTTIVHHQDVLVIGPLWYAGLVDVVLAVLLETVPDDCPNEHAFWRAIREDIISFIDGVRAEFWRQEDDGPIPAFDPGKLV